MFRDFVPLKCCSTVLATAAFLQQCCLSVLCVIYNSVMFCYFLGHNNLVIHFLHVCCYYELSFILLLWNRYSTILWNSYAFRFYFRNGTSVSYSFEIAHHVFPMRTFNIVLLCTCIFFILWMRITWFSWITLLECVMIRNPACTSLCYNFIEWPLLLGAVMYHLYGCDIIQMSATAMRQFTFRNTLCRCKIIQTLVFHF